MMLWFQTVVMRDIDNLRATEVTNAYRCHSPR
jgi:hypothetical protein